MTNLIERIKSVAGQDFDSYGCRVRNPHITARQSIEIADYIVKLEQKRNELAAKVERLTAIPYTKTRTEFMESWGVDGMSGDKKRLANAAWDRAEWFFNQQAVAFKAQWQADAFSTFVSTLENIKNEAECSEDILVKMMVEFSIKLIERHLASITQHTRG